MKDLEKEGISLILQMLLLDVREQITIVVLSNR